MRTAFYLDGSPMLSNNLRAYPESESSPNIAFRTDERLKQRLPDLRFNPGSAIRNSHANSWTRAVAVLARVRADCPEEKVARLAACRPQLIWTSTSGALPAEGS